MDKKTILALIFIGAIFLLWPVYMRKVVGVKSPPTQRSSESLVDESTTLQRQEAPVRPQTLTDQTRPVQSYIPRPDVTAMEYGVDHEIVEIETNLFQGKLSSLGGGTIVGWKLKQYLDQAKEWVELLPDSAQGNLSILLGDRNDLGTLVFQTALDTQWVDNGKHFQRVRFVRDLPNGGRIEKEFNARDDSYMVDMQVRFYMIDRQIGPTGYDVVWNSGLNPTERLRDETPYYQAYALQGGEILKTKEDKKQGEGTTQWVAVRTKYFLMALIPRDREGTAARLEGKKKPIQYREEKSEWKTFHLQLAMPFSGDIEEISNFSIYLGPMDYTRLKSNGAELLKMMNLGWPIIRPFSIAFFHVLQFLYGIVGNFGWAIIIFSILIKVVLYPLTRKSFQSMRKMQELQPKLTALKEKLKKEPQKLN